MVSRVLTSLALGLALVACDGANATLDAANESARENPPAAAEKSADVSDDRSPASDDAVDAPPSDGWMDFSSEADRFEARLPGAPTKQTFDTPNPQGGTIPTTMYLSEKGSRAVGVGVTTVPAGALKTFDIDGALDGARNGMVSNIGGTLISEKQVQYAGHPARALVAKAAADGTPVQIEARLFFVEPRLYQVLVVHAESEPFASEKFFDGFALLAE